MKEQDPPMSTLFVYAAPREGAWLAQRRVATLELGVGKIAAAASLTVALIERRPQVVVQFGVCGAYPARHLRAGLAELRVLDTCVVASEVVVDDGVQTPEGFRDLAQLSLQGPAEAGPIVADVERSRAIASLLGCPMVAGATVSTGAGTEALSEAYAARSGAQVESMEGGAVAAVCRRFGVAHVQLRVVSNRTGDRALSGWDLDGSITVLTSAVERVLASGVM
jgi:futalosine hydrolase